MKRIAYLLFATAVLLLGMATPAHADLYPFKWQQPTVKIHDASKYDSGYVLRMAKQWNQGKANIQLVDSATPCSGCIIIDDASASELPSGVNIGGAAYITQANGAISHCVAKVNRDILDRPWSPEYFKMLVANVVVHEVRHCTGGAHTTAPVKSIMLANQYLFGAKSGLTKGTKYDYAELLRQYGSR